MKEFEAVGACSVRMGKWEMCTQFLLKAQKEETTQNTSACVCVCVYVCVCVSRVAQSV
jgi:menaquinone-dependent protoporphyrinogen IX oxidase